MTLLVLLLVLAVVGGVAAVVAGLAGGGLDEPTPSVPQRSLPRGPISGRDVEELRFVRAFRGYRMDQVDDALDVLGAEIDRLRGLLAATDASGRVDGFERPERTGGPDRAGRADPAVSAGRSGPPAAGPADQA